MAAEHGVGGHLVTGTVDHFDITTSSGELSFEVVKYARCTAGRPTALLEWPR